MISDFFNKLFHLGHHDSQLNDSNAAASVVLANPSATASQPNGSSSPDGFILGNQVGGAISAPLPQKKTVHAFVSLTPAETPTQAAHRNKAVAAFNAGSDVPHEINGELYRSFPNRDGYDPNFLGLPLPLPELDASIKDQAAPLLDDPSQTELKYTHFSVVMNKERRCPMLTAANLDGNDTKDSERKGTWTLDARIDRKYQLGNEAYSDNDIDKGHQVRRRDPMWGKDALKAESDTFVYTNSGLQHAELNQKSWYDLEEHVLHGAIENHQKKAVFTGPVLSKDDPTFDNAGKIGTPTQIPTKFWKVEVWNEPGKGLEGEAFVLSQKDMLDKPRPKTHYDHLTPMQIKTFRVPMKQLEDMTHIHFGPILDVDDDRSAAPAVAVAA
jgi:endonuclease G